MDSTSIALTLVLGTVAGLAAFEIWGWLPVMTRALEGARRRLAVEEKAGDESSERFGERRLAGLIWSASRLSLALVRQLRSAPRPATDFAAAGSALGVILALSYFLFSLLLGGAPDDLRGAVLQLAAWGATGGGAGQLLAWTRRLMRGD